MTKATKKKEIDPKGWYTLQDIVLGRFFPWASSFYSVRNAVENDRRNGNILKTEITGKKQGMKYHFEGKNIIRFIEVATTTEPWKGKATK